jgi:hypothetical protein
VTRSETGLDEELAAWCRRWLVAEPVAVLFQAGYLSQVTSTTTPAPPGSTGSRPPSASA